MGVESYYHAEIAEFLGEDNCSILGTLALGHRHDLNMAQRDAWTQQIAVLKQALLGLSGIIILECYIPRMGKRADAVLLINGIVFVLEFKVGAESFGRDGLDQVEDYALDLKNFHEGSHEATIVPVLVATRAETKAAGELHFADDCVAAPLACNGEGLGALLRNVVSQSDLGTVDSLHWMQAGYKPTPTIIEAAQVLYETHDVVNIARTDAGAINLQQTSEAVSFLIDQARRMKRKAICFITGVPGSGKTLAGLNIATKRSDEHADEHAVFLSGNGPLVDVLREALARDKVAREKCKKADAAREVRSFIQNIHHFRDDYVGNLDVPAEKVVVFDEAQRAWTRKQAASFMQRKRGHMNFDVSEPEFLISVMDRHEEWCAIVCLVGGGQEINTGEAGISEWILALQRRYPNWDVHVSPRIVEPDYGAELELSEFLNEPRVHQDENLHLAVSMRSFRAEALSEFVGHVVDSRADVARKAYYNIRETYPIYVTRDIGRAREWLRNTARGTERFGLVASSGAARLRPVGVHMKAAVDPANWFLNDARDVRSSFFLEEVASEFDVQGLELDWAGVCWDGDFHHDGNGWVHQAFKGKKWQSVNDLSRRLYLKNAHRVILTRARQGMVILVPHGDDLDWTRPRQFYDGTYAFLRACGVTELP
jgi:hypothetical protein